MSINRKSLQRGWAPLEALSGLDRIKPENTPFNPPQRSVTTMVYQKPVCAGQARILVLAAHIDEGTDEAEASGVKVKGVSLI